MNGKKRKFEEGKMEREKKRQYSSTDEKGEEGKWD